MWLDPRPTVEDIGKAYEMYYTHGAVVSGTTFQAHVKRADVLRSAVRVANAGIRRLQDSVLTVRFGYQSLARGAVDWWLDRMFGCLPGVVQGARMQVLGLYANEAGRILDVGCGNGTFLARMQSLGWSAVGYETDPVAAKFARDNFSLDVREGLLSDAAQGHEAFDVVTLSHVIEHVHVPEILLRQCLTLVKPGGKLIILTPNTRSIGHRHFREHWRGLEPPRHIHCFNSRTLRACVERSGLRVEHISTPTRMMRAIWYASRLIQRADAGSGKVNNAFDYVTSYVMQLIESAACKFRMDAGEEIMLVARRPLPETRMCDPADVPGP